MDRLWAPWRFKYVADLGHKHRGCIFCGMSREKNDRKNFIFMRTKYSFAVLNIYPYNNGHVLVVPYRHLNGLSKLRSEEKADLFCLLETAQQIIEKTLKPQGFNIGINIGRVAGAGFPGHLHIHLVPRWGGDVNFMPIVANTRIVSQSLEALFKRLQHNTKKNKRKNHN